MKRFQQILVALSGAESDKDVLSWARQITRAAGTSRLDFVVLDPEPADWVPEFPAPAGAEPWKQRQEEITETIAEVFADEGAELETHVAVGAPLPSLLKEISDSDADLVVVGVESEADRRLAEKLARKCPVSLLSVPQGSSTESRSILTPIDFSDPAALALDLAQAFSEGLGAGKLVCLHSFSLTSRMLPPGVSMEEMRKDYSRVAAFELEQFVKKNSKGGVTPQTVVREAGLPSTAVLDEVKSGSHGLVVMATRGRSSIARALLGSNTAEVIRRSPVPVLAVKAKGEGLSLLKTILENQQLPSPKRPLYT